MRPCGEGVKAIKHVADAHARQWVVERTFGWLGRHRRISKDYEYVPETSETWISIAMSRLMLKRLAREEGEPPFHYRRVA